VRAIVQGGEAKALLPSSLIELIEQFLGTRAVTADRIVTAQPLRNTWLALERPLDPGRREFVSLPVSVKPPPAYLPQAIAIAIGRWMDAGPLMLLYLGRLANALVALTMLTWAVALIPIGRSMVMLFGLLPMAIYEYASLSPDATVITTAFLFVALALKAELRTRWSPGDVILAAFCGLVFCSQKPVYAPLLFVGLPMTMVRVRPNHTLLVHAILIPIVLGGTLAWQWFSSQMLSVPEEVSVSGQLSFIAQHPLAYLQAMADILWRAHFFYRSVVGNLGWFNVSLPTFAYGLPLLGFLLSTLAQPPGDPRLTGPAVAWQLLLLLGAMALIMTAAYLFWNPVGSDMIHGVQGRYFLPLLALLAALWCSVVPTSRSRRVSLAPFLALAGIILVQQGITDLTILEAYHEF
jgi:uncharacterized membrane protein